jgi:hypothetical protein
MIHIYHPNKAVKGFACSFWFSHKHNSFFATLIKQSGWDDQNQNGTFKDSLKDPNKKVSIKLSEIEVCSILDCVERNRPFSTFHDAEESPKSISFTPWMAAAGASAIDDDTPAKTQQRGFSFSIVVNPKDETKKNSFYIGLTFAEGRYIREFLIHYLHHQFDKNVPSNTEERPAQEPLVNV